MAPNNVSKVVPLSLIIPEILHVTLGDVEVLLVKGHVRGVQFGAPRLQNLIACGDGDILGHVRAWGKLRPRTGARPDSRGGVA